MRVLIADDHKLIVDGIKRALEESPDFEVVGEASSGSQVLPLVGRTKPDLVLLDLRMPGADGLTCLAQIRKRHPEVKVVVLSVSTDENVIQTVLKRGASAYIVRASTRSTFPPRCGKQSRAPCTARSACRRPGTTRRVRPA